MLRLISRSRNYGITNFASKLFKANNNKVVDKDGSKANETIENLSKNLTYILNIGAIKKSIFLTLDATKVFNHLKQAFIKAPIL